MKAILVTLALVLGFTSTITMACPKGTHIVGGTGTHHKGGKCVGADTKADAKADAKAEEKAPAATEAKSEEKAADAPAEKKTKKKSKTK